MEPTTQLDHILPTLCTLVDGIRLEQLNDPTPCAAFTVHDVLDHMMVLGGSFSSWFRGRPASDVKAPAVFGAVPAEQFRAVISDLHESVRSPGAMERTIDAPFGELPGLTFARFVALDGVLHGWDLATATGQPYEIDPDVLRAVDEFARTAITDHLRDGDTFADPTEPPADATSLERLAAFSGRVVNGRR
jgi:uncharacterized protein (TIGR03086 family)